MHHRLILLLLCVGLGIPSFSTAQSIVTAVKLEEPIKIDGILEPILRDQQTPISGFIQFAPNPLAPSKQQTKVWIGYTDEAIYIQAELLDSAPDSILSQLSERDRLRNTDWFAVSINPYQDGINATNFIVSPDGVQYDSKFGAENGGDSQVMQTGDISWDGVWSSACAKTSTGWVAELKILYSALRFPDNPIQTWDINFARQIRRYREESFWHPVNPKLAAITTQMGTLSGIREIKPPIRLQATPFITAGTAHSSDPTRNRRNEYGSSIGGGLDLKYGLTDAFTLDLTAIPDFSNTRSDDQVLNLGANEIFFDENRAFFTEGVELFNKGGFFYSRRVGGIPFNYSAVEDQLTDNESILENPTKTRLLNATKVSGRLSNGLGIGVFNATEGKTFAKVKVNSSGDIREIETGPTTNYSVVSFDQNLKNNSFVTLINTTVLRDGSAYDANLTGLVFDLRNESNSFGIAGKAGVSQQYGISPRSNSGIAENPIDSSKSNTFGHTYSLNVRKLTGRFRYGANFNVESDTYNPNDLGFIFFNNERSGEIYSSYNWFEPFGIFNSASISGSIGSGFLFKPDIFTGAYSSFNSRFTTRKFFTFGFNATSDLSETKEFQDTRTPGRYYTLPQYAEAGGFISSDYRKRFALDVRTTFGRFYKDGRSQTRRLSISPRFRASDKLDFRLSSSIAHNLRYLGYLGHSMIAIDNYQLRGLNTPFIQLNPSIPGYDALDEESILGSYRTIRTIALEANTTYSFTANMNLSLRIRHYWSKVNHEEFFDSRPDGSKLTPTYTGLDADGNFVHNQNFNAFNVDFFWRWRFAPGSDAFISYKTQSFFEGNFNDGFFQNIGALGTDRVDNNLTLKVVYWLDAASI